MIVYGSLHFLLDYERVLFQCDELRIPAATLNYLNDVCLTNHTYEWITTYNFQAAQI